MKSLKTSTSFNSSIVQLIDRLYPRASQNAARIILKAYFTQSADVRRRMTLDSLGKLDTLEKKVTRERARQIIAKFTDEILVKEFKLLQRGIELKDDILINNRKDLQNLVEVIRSICKSLESYSLPIFAERVHQDLKDKRLIDNAIYIPIVVELAESVSIETKFDIYDHDGYRIILKKGANKAYFTSELIKHAGKVSTHMGAVFPLEKLFDPEWHRNLPKHLNSIIDEIDNQYKIDLLTTQSDFILLQDSEYFAFIDRDERISSMLLPIFKVYSEALPKDKLLNALKTGLTQRFMTKKNDKLRENELKIINNSSEAIDEYCIRTLLLESVSDFMRFPGEQISKRLANYEPGDLYDAQIKVVNEIKKYGEPLSSMSFGKLYREDLKLRESFKVTLYTYPVLYYKEGGGRRNDLYKTLDGVYEIIEKETKDSKTIEREKNSLNKSITKRKIEELYEKIKNIDFDNLPLGQLRLEQGLLRNYLIESSQKEQYVGSNEACKCLICNRYFPNELLIASHVKKRSLCSIEEKLDIENIAMLQCSFCDKLFEYGYIYLSDIGVVKINQYAPLTKDLSKAVSTLRGNKSEYYNKSKSRSSYIKYHRDLSLTRFQSEGLGVKSV